MTHLVKAEESALMVGAANLLSEGVSFIYTFQSVMSKEEKQKFVLWANAVRRWHKEMYKGDKC